MALLAGCVVAPRQDAPADPIADCREVFRRVDDAVEQAGVADGMAARVPGFPYLRVSRFLASYARDDLSAARFDAWLERMTVLGQEARRIELANLPAGELEQLGHSLMEVGARHAWPRDAVEECAKRMAAADRGHPGRRAELRGAARVPDDYSTALRAAGLYWLTRVPFAGGIRDWHREVRGVYAQPLDALPVAGALRTYAPPPGRLAAAEVAALLERASANALGIPDPRGADLEAMYRTFAPGFIVDTAGDADVPGELGWGEAGLPRVVSRLPVVYRRVSHARYGERVLLQLNYWLWFPERPPGPGWDILGGPLDGVLWRVTLAPDGAPWVFDSIHPCGCYHLFFPTARAAPKAQPDTLDETAFVPQVLPRVEPGARIELRVESRTHYLQRAVFPDGPAQGAMEYVFAEDDGPRSLPLPDGGRRSIYRPDGIVPGSERGERWLFWPMGVPEPGAMRQWGRHATAFVGRRHFDDPWLIERYFTLDQP